jgi:Ca2+-binding RTX toxin-like protein
MPTYTGGAGNDSMGQYSGVGAYTVYGGAGNDTINGYTGSDYLMGEDGDDRIYGGFGNDTILGGNGNDILDGWDNNDRIDGGAGNDTIYGGNNADTITGGLGNDRIYGDDDAYGEVGKDVLSGGAGNDSLYGGADGDIYLFTFNSDGMDFVIDTKNDGSYDTLRINGVTALNQLTIKSASVIGHSSSNLLVYTDADKADGVLSEYVEVVNYFNGSGYGVGKIEWLDVNGSNFSFDTVINSGTYGTA